VVDFSKDLPVVQTETGSSAAERLKQLLKYLEFTPNNANLLSDVVTTAIEAKDTDAAKAALGNALAQQPVSAELLAHAGLMYLQLNEHTAAYEALRQAVENGVEDISVTYNLAYSQYQLRDFAGAMKTLAPVLTSDELPKEVAMLSARCKHNTDSLESGIEQLESFLAQRGHDADVEGLLALLLCDNDQPDAALTHANRTLKTSPLNFDALIARAGANMTSRSYHSALSDFTKASSINPSSGRAWSGLAQVAFYNFEFDSALDHLQKAVRHMPDHIGTWHLLGWTWLMKEDYSSALEAFEESYKLDRNFGETHGALASVYALAGQADKAEKHIKLAKKLAPEGFSYLYASMVMLNKQNRQQEAQALFEKVKTTHYAALGTTPAHLVESRLKELAEKETRH
jgi:tetratricopeptide (TPR) repeat protein